MEIIIAHVHTYWVLIEPWNMNSRKKKKKTMLCISPAGEEYKEETLRLLEQWIWKNFRHTDLQNINYKIFHACEFFMSPLEMMELKNMIWCSPKWVHWLLKYTISLSLLESSSPSQHPLMQAETMIKSYLIICATAIKWEGNMLTV